MTTTTLNGPRLAPASGAAAKGLVIFVHGYGSNGDDLIQIGHMWSQALPDLAWVSPNAPEPVPGAPGGYQWWDFMRAARGDRSAGIRLAAPLLDAFIDEELARHGLTEDRLALVGFSQGTMMSLFVAPRRTRQIAGVIGYSGRLIDPESLPTEAASKPPVLLIHGDADPMVPVQSTLQAAEALNENGFEVSMHIARGVGHSIDQDGLVLGARFLREVLP